MHVWIVAAVSFVHGRARERTGVRLMGGWEGWWRLPVKKRRAGAAVPSYAVIRTRTTRKCEVGEEERVVV